MPPGTKRRSASFMNRETSNQCKACAICGFRVLMNVHEERQARSAISGLHTLHNNSSRKKKVGGSLRGQGRGQEISAFCNISPIQQKTWTVVRLVSADLLTVKTEAVEGGRGMLKASAAS